VNETADCELGYKEFSAALESLLPKRFLTNEVKFLWEKITQNGESLNFALFSSFLNNNKFTKEDMRSIRYHKQSLL
jgi:hypothetical protein